MDILLNPNVAYLLLAGGLVCAVLSLLSPGTGVLEILALFTLVLAGVGIYSLPINLWAMAILIAGVVVFVISTRRPKDWYLLALAILALVVGSAFLFGGEEPVNPLLAAVVSALSAIFFWIAARKTMEARLARPDHDLGKLIGAIGEAKTPIQEDGSVQVAGELWSAHSANPIPTGARVRVTQREGFILEVEVVDSAKA